MAKKPMPTIGVSDYTIIPIEQDAYGRDIYRAPVKLPGTVQVSPTDSGGSDAFDADNGIYEAETYLENIGHEITNADIPPEVEAMLRGLTRTNGVLDVGASILAPRFGVAWRLLKLDGTYRYVLYYNGRYSFASNVAGKTRPSSGASEKQTALATFTAMPNDEGKHYRYEDDAGLTDKEKAELEEIYMGTAAAKGFNSITPQGKITEYMGIYSWLGDSGTLTAAFPAASNGAIAISFSAKLPEKQDKHTTIQISRENTSLVNFDFCTYRGETSTTNPEPSYRAEVGNFSTANKDEVLRGMHSARGRALTAWTHFKFVFDIDTHKITAEISNDANDETASYEGSFKGNMPNGIYISSNHDIEDRAIIVKRLICAAEN